MVQILFYGWKANSAFTTTTSPAEIDVSTARYNLIILYICVAIVIFVAWRSNGFKSALIIHFSFVRNIIDSKAKYSRQEFRDKAKLLENWFIEHKKFPYPSYAEKLALADQGCMSVEQVSATRRGFPGRCDQSLVRHFLSGGFDGVYIWMATEKLRGYLAAEHKERITVYIAFRHAKRADFHIRFLTGSQIRGAD